MYYVYILYCSNNTYYVGLTVNLKKRLLNHREGKTISTKNRRPILLKFYACFPNKSLAAQFEQYLKTHSGRAFLQKRLVKQGLPGEANQRLAKTGRGSSVVEQ
ncbi:GIY-YIG nuclease family protein [Patescibacteria group bacterium]|nr:GIY-YIG nuclease family protein [Patescibacteria group bacterium]MBU1895595.1 GIY-YIG nuclease family protein [Patescibacteria group bacterium]